jgi:hypothetical protein
MAALSIARFVEKLFIYIGLLKNPFCPLTGPQIAE